LHGSIKGAADELHKLRGENNHLKTELEEVSQITKRHEERIEGMRSWARDMDAELDRANELLASALFGADKELSEDA
jgi:predicted RNase H-like nuclease (RuvC/YqgF family)